ncbi:MAG: FkbM family methyltransferase [Patescibacteria group bacterium]
MLRQIKKILPGKFKTFLVIVLATKNWFNILLTVFLLQQEVLAVFRSGYRFKVSRKIWPEFMNYVSFFRYFPSGEINDSRVKIKYKSKNLIFNVGKLNPNFLSEVFGWEAYKSFLGDFDARDKSVVDIGAALGDTAIYFAVQGAKKVYAFEPLPELCRLAEENIKINKLENICHVFNAGVGKEKNMACSKNMNFEYMYGSKIKEYKNKEAIQKEATQIIVLQDIVNKFKISNAILKIDCEGCEYEIILNTTDEVLKRFGCILMEYHYGFENLKAKLEGADFRVKYTKPFGALRPEREKNRQNMSVGYLAAYRD